MTLKALQAEWRRISQRTDADHQYAGHMRKCADALSPHIEQQERDMDLIRRLSDEVDAGVDHYVVGPECITCNLVKEARSRLKEME